MSAAMQLKQTPEVEVANVAFVGGDADDGPGRPRRIRQLAILETVLEDYRPALRELANR